MNVNVCTFLPIQILTMSVTLVSLNLNGFILKSYKSVSRSVLVYKVNSSVNRQKRKCMIWPNFAGFYKCGKYFACSGCFEYFVLHCSAKLRLLSRQHVNCNGCIQYVLPIKIYRYLIGISKVRNVFQFQWFIHWNTKCAASSFLLKIF